MTHQTKGIQNSFEYIGEVYHEETGLYYLWARYYDPSEERFLNEDTYEGQIDNPLIIIKDLSVTEAKYKQRFSNLLNHYKSRRIKFSTFHVALLNDEKDKWQLGSSFLQRSI
ncbi:RHS repeat-associated core domain-containing protein [Paenibacillus sp. BR2-3]|uniref:RHS repeat-associated core domain-containing protein n=1 Tax=Paenibacillus sp. BR2-3 TaxID=3048494 RepID=UPI00397745B6